MGGSFEDFLTKKVQREGKREGGGVLLIRFRFRWNWCMVDYLLSPYNQCAENVIVTFLKTFWVISFIALHMLQEPNNVTQPSANKEEHLVNTGQFLK